MTITFSQKPGMRERHLQRQYHNPLFSLNQKEFEQARVDGAVYADEGDIETFILAFHSLVEKVANLKGNEDSETILLLKEQLDLSYEQCSGLAGEQDHIKQAIVKLVAVIMNAVRQGAEGDAEAMKNLEEEDLAREMHYRLLATPLVADLLNPKSPIAEAQLVPTLLSETEQALAAALQIFDPVQLELLCQNARLLLNEKMQQQINLPEAWQRLEQMEKFLAHNY